MLSVVISQSYAVNSQLFVVSDKSSLCWRKGIGGVALQVNGKASTLYAVIGAGHGGRAYGGCQGQGGISLQPWNLLGVASFLAK
jgi:hypothetical protein